MTEYRNQNSNTRYPFADDCDMLAVGGYRLGDDVVVDACVIAAALPSLESISVSELEISIRGVGVADFAEGAQTVYGDMGERRGVVVLGPGVEDVKTAAADLEFSETAAVFCPRAVVGAEAEGVVGVKAGTETMYGDLVFEGENGVVASSESGKLRFDIDIETVNPWDCDDGGCGLVKRICFVREAGTSPFSVSALDDHSVAITGYELELDDICAPRRRTMPDDDGYLPFEQRPGDDVCTAAVDPEPIPTGPEMTGCVEPYDGNIFVLAPSPDPHMNPFYIDNDPGTPTFRRLRVDGPISDAAQGMPDVNLFMRPPHPRGRMEIGIRGSAAQRLAVRS